VTRNNGTESTLWPDSPESAEAALSCDDPRRISRALLTLALNGPDFGVAERRALEHLDHPDVWVRRNAATSLSHVARLAGHLDLETVMPALISLLREPEVYGEADDALDEIEHVLGVNRGTWLGDPAIRAIKYGHHAQVVEVQLADGSVYQYSGVDPFDYRDLWTVPPAPLEGTDFLAALDRYPRRKVRVPRLTKRSRIALQAR
jgi:KTSC domain